LSSLHNFLLEIENEAPLSSDMQVIVRATFFRKQIVVVEKLSNFNPKPLRV